MFSVSFEDNKFIFKSDRFEKEIPKNAGFIWKPEIIKNWHTYDISKAKRLEEYADESALYQFKASEQAVAMSHAAHTDIELPCPPGLEYLPFQKAGIQYVISQYSKGKEACLIGDEMGLGKTIQAIGVINTDVSIRDVIIIVPAILKINWRDELQKWLIRNYRIVVRYSKQNKAAEYYSQNEKSEIYGTITIINYDILKNNIDILLKDKYDLLIGDEAHYLKNGTAQRTKEVAKIAKVASKKLWLTGTPITKYPLDLYPILKMSNHTLSHSWPYFTKRYCNPQIQNFRSRSFTKFGSSNEAELQENLRSGLMIRRLKKDVLKELPAKTRQVITLPADTVSGAISAEKVYLKTLKDNAKKIRQQHSFIDAVEKLRENKSASLAEMAKVRKETAIAKIPLAVQHLESILESQDKVVVFAWHKEVINKVHEHFKKISVMITGETEQGVRQDNIKAFQNDPKIKVFCGNILACGVGITLTAAQTVVFLELDWTPANIQQAEDRLHRIGQAGNVLVQFLVIDGSIDSRIAKGLVVKMKRIDKALNQQEVAA